MGSGGVQSWPSSRLAVDSMLTTKEALIPLVLKQCQYMCWLHLENAD